MAIRPDDSVLETESGPADGRPLYSRVRLALCERIRAGIWRPGQKIPSEIEIGRELGVSQGTVRKALDSLASEKLVVRRQGKGTFVVEHTPDDVLFRFFQIFGDDGGRIRPEPGANRATVLEANPAQRQRLRLARGAKVIRIDRLRNRDGVPFVSETVVLSSARFPGLLDSDEIPNTLYDLFQNQYGILVARADERLTAVAADRRAARLLKVALGTPLLRIDRLAFALDDKPIEWRISLVHLDGMHYLARLR